MERKDRKEIYKMLDTFGSFGQKKINVNGLYLCGVGMNCMRNTGKYSRSYDVYPASLRIRHENCNGFVDVYTSFDHGISSDDMEIKIVKILSNFKFEGNKIVNRD